MFTQKLQPDYQQAISLVVLVLKSAYITLHNKRSLLIEVTDHITRLESARLL